MKVYVCVMCQEVNETLVDTPGEECKMYMTLKSKVLLLFVELCGSISLLGVFSHVFFENTRLLLSTIGMKVWTKAIQMMPESC